jgi:hypothetical protein
MGRRAVRKQILAAITALTAAACGGGGGPAGPSGTPRPGVAVALIEVTTTADLEVGTEIPLRATARYLDGTEVVVTSDATWESGTPEVATVKPGGAVRGVKPGNAVIRASFGGQTGELKAPVLGRRVDVTVLTSAFVCVADCDNTLNGKGDFTYDVEVHGHGSDSSFVQYQTLFYPDSSGQIKLGNGQQDTINRSKTFKLREQPDDWIDIYFGATEWDIQGPDNRLDDSQNWSRFDWNEVSGWGSAPGPHSVRLGSGSCVVRLDFNISFAH